jgi:branched-chain amino acid transport system permease protein
MLYSDAGQFSRSYRDGARSFRLRREFNEVLVLLVLGFGVVPLIGDDYWYSAILVPFLILALALLPIALSHLSAALLGNAVEQGAR